MQIFFENRIGSNRVLNIVILLVWSLFLEHTIIGIARQNSDSPFRHPFNRHPNPQSFPFSILIYPRCVTNSHRISRTSAKRINSQIRHLQVISIKMELSPWSYFPSMTCWFRFPIPDERIGQKNTLESLGHLLNVMIKFLLIVRV